MLVGKDGFVDTVSDVAVTPTLDIVGSGDGVDIEFRMLKTRET